MPSDEPSTCPCCLGISYYSSSLHRMGKQPLCFGIRSKLDTNALPQDIPEDGRPGKKDGFYLTCVGFSFRRNNDEALPECEGIELLTISSSSSSSSTSSPEAKVRDVSAGPARQETFVDKAMIRARENIDLIRIRMASLHFPQDSPASIDSIKSLGSRVIARGGHNVERVGEVISQLLGRSK